MKAKNLVKLFFVFGLILAIVGMLGSPICRAQDEYKSNIDSNVEAQEIDRESVGTFEEGEWETEEEISYLPRSSAPILSIPAAAFSSDGNHPDGFFYFFTGGYIRGDDYAFLKAPVILPNGAQIRFFYVSCYDNDPGSNFTVSLRKTHALGATTTICSATTSGASAAVYTLQSSSPTDEIVSYQYCYALTTCLSSSNERIFSIRIYYYLPDETHLHKLILDD